MLILRNLYFSFYSIIFNNFSQQDFFNKNNPYPQTWQAIG